MIVAGGTYNTAALALALLSLVSSVTADIFDYGESKFPDGPYSLPVPATGCVEDETRGWAPGYILFGSLVNSSSTLLTNDAPNWPGFAKNGSFMLSFCTKLERDLDSGVVEWPVGHYGVFKAGSDCPPGFVERSDHFQLPEFQTWESEGTLPDIDLFPDEFSMKFTTCIREQSSDGSNIPNFAKPVYLLKDPALQCPEFDSYDVTEERLASKCKPETNCASLSLCHVTPKKTPQEPLYELTEWNGLGFAARCLEALGMADGTITDEQLSATSFFSFWFLQNSPENARPGKPGWSPDVETSQREYEYFEIDLRSVMMIEGIEVQYRATFESGGAANLTSGNKYDYSPMFRIKHAIAYRHFRLYNDKMLIIRREEVDLLMVNPFAARFVRIDLKINPDVWSMRFELIGCKQGVKIGFDGWTESVLPSMCFDELGLMDGTIFDFQITASLWISEHEPSLARPGLSGWCADPDEPNPYIQVDLIVPTYVQGLTIYDVDKVVKSMQDGCGVSSKVDKYTNVFVSFAEESPVFQPYKEMPFSVSTVNTTKLLFLERFLAKSLRIEIITVGTDIPACLRFKIIGCRFEGFMSTTCSESVASIWIDDPIILPETEPVSVLNVASLEDCQELCLDELDDTCSLVRFSNGNNCTMYNASEVFRSTIISPVSNAEMLSTRICMLENGSVHSLTIQRQFIFGYGYGTERIDLISSGYPFHYASAVEQSWTIKASFSIFGSDPLEMLFTNISLYPPTTDDCEDIVRIKIRNIDDTDWQYLVLTHEYNGAILFVPCSGSTIYMKLMPCPRAYVGGQRHYGIRAIVDEYKYVRAVWPNASSPADATSEDLSLHTFSLLGHPLRTLTKDTWTIRVSGNLVAAFSYFNVPCHKGHQLTLATDTASHRYCGNSRPEWTFSSGVVTIEYTYGEPVLAAGFSAAIVEGSSVPGSGSGSGLEGYVWPGKDLGCTYDALSCNRTLGPDTLNMYCLEQDLICDGERHCEYDEDESEYGCQNYLTSVCSEETHRCYFLKEIIGEQGYWTNRTYTKDCSDLDGRYTLPIIHNEQQMISLQQIIQQICIGRFAPGCFGGLYLDIGLRRYITDDGIEELWEDGTKVSFTARRGPRTPIHLCTSLVFDNNANDGYKWVDRPCEQSMTSAVVLCEQPFKQGKQGITFTPNGTSDPPTLRFSSHKCGSGEVIHMAAVCDGIADCFDGSDETGCETFLGGGCTSEEFACGNGTCIGLHNVCDYKQDCFPDGDDELCAFLDCTANEFTCQNRECIPSYSRCDAVKDCIDGTDEILCESCNDTVAFPCEDLTCIHKAFVCDGIHTCKYGRDEMNCESGWLSTCFEWWQAGFGNGSYLLDDVLSVQCTFTQNDDSTVNVLTQMDLEVIGHEEGFKLNITSLRPYVYITPWYRRQAEDSLCEMEIDVGCTPNIRKMIEYNEMGWDGVYNLCGAQTINIRFNWSRDVVISESDSQGISAVHIESEQRPDILIIQPKMSIVRYSTVDIGKLKCFTELRVEKERAIGCGDGTVAPESTRCIYDIGRAGNLIGCPSFTHLDNCGDFNCSSADYVKCPGDFCIPERFVCDGVKHCRDGADELDCGCGERDDQVTIVYSGDASEVKRSYIYKFGRLLLSSGSDVRVVSLGIGKKNILVKSRLIHGSNEALNLNKWQTNSTPLTEVTDFIVTPQSFPHNIIAIFDDDKLDSININNAKTSSQEQIHIYTVRIDSSMRLSSMKSEDVKRTEIFVKGWDILGSVGPSLMGNCQGNSPDRCIGKFKCMSSMMCIPLHQLCDGITQCTFGDDERLCDLHCPANCLCGNYVIDCKTKTLNTTFLRTLSTSVRNLDLSYSRGIFENNNVSFPKSLSLLGRLNISSCSITDVADNAFEKTRSLFSLDIGNNKLRYITRLMFKGLTKLRHLIMTGNNQLESLESHAFQDLVNIKSLTIVNTRLFEIVSETFAGLRLSTLDISSNSIRKIHDMAFSGLDVSTLKMDGNDIRELSSKSFTDMRYLESIIAPAFQICCYRPDYVKGQNCLPGEDEFSSCEDLMRSSALQILLWVVGLSALVGNCLSILYRVTVDKERLKLGFGIFVTNLAISDFLMGIYLLIIAVADVNYRNRYYEVEADWRTGNVCKLAGVLATVSSEASVAFMCLITLDRILVIRFPFGKVRFRTKSAVAFSVGGWVLAWFIALYPLMNSKSFEGQFYSKSGVCLALPLTPDRSPGWLYSVLMFVGLNFVTFILIAVGQIIIYLEIKKHTDSIMKKDPTKQSTSRRNDMIDARNVFFVLTTDFLCWFPIGVMAFRAIDGHPMSDDVYAWTAVLVLPINAALNPIMYTAAAFMRRKQFNTSLEEQSRKAGDQTSLKRLLLSRHIFKHSREDMAPVSTLMSDEQWTAQPATTLLLARSIVKILSKMHACDIIHGELDADNVFVSSTMRSEVFMNVMPKACKDEAEKKKDINDFGQLLHGIMKYM